MAVPGSFRLVPPEERFSAVKRDYRDMTAMFFSEPLGIEAVLQQPSVLERQINRL